MTNPEVAARHLVRGVLTGRSDQPDQPVTLEIDEGRRWWKLTDTATAQELLGSAVQTSDSIIPSGNTIKWRGRVITLDADQDAALLDLVAATSRVRFALEDRQPGNGQPPEPQRPTLAPGAVSASAPSAVSASRDTTLQLAGFVLVFSLVLGCVAVVGLLIGAASTVEECTSQFRCEETRPFLWPGIGMALAAALQAAFVAMIASFVKTRTLETARQ